MKAGALTKLVTIQSRDAGTDAAGQPLQTWTTVGTEWAEPRGANGMQTIRSALDGVEINWYSWRIRYKTTYNAGMRLVVDGLNYDLKQVRHDHAKKQWTDLVSEVGGNDG